MNKEKWTCLKCGYEDNDGAFCDKCGAPRFFMSPEEPEETLTLKEARKRKETHGSLTACCFSHRSSGMAMNSDSRSRKEISRDGDEFILKIQEKEGLQPEILKKYRVDPEVMEELQQIVESENMAAWSKVKDEPDPAFIPLDYSSSSFLSLSFADCDESFCIGLHAIYRQGGGETIEKIRKIIESCETEEKLLEHKEIKDPRKPFFLKDEEITDDMWTCPECGYRKNTGRFCSECGSRKPK